MKVNRGWLIMLVLSLMAFVLEIEIRASAGWLIFGFIASALFAYSAFENELESTVLTGGANES